MKRVVIRIRGEDYAYDLPISIKTEVKTGFYEEYSRTEVTVEIPEGALRLLVDLLRELLKSEGEKR